MMPPRDLEPGVLYAQAPDGSWVPIGTAAGPPALDAPDERPVSRALPTEVIAVGLEPEHVDNIRAVFGEVGETWERSPDVARWSADGSHEHDPPAWTAQDGTDAVERILARITEGLAESAAALGEWAALMHREMVLFGELFVEHALGDLENWRPIGIVQDPRYRRAAASEALRRWDEARERARHRCQEDRPPVVDTDAPPTDPRGRALWARRQRGTGPAGPRLDGRRH